jgi:predicted MFS family arabinose efflux permease
VKRGAGMSGPLRLREYRLLFCGQCVSNLGDWLDFIALTVLIAYVWEMGPSALAALSIAIAIPWIFVAPFAGVWVDRWPKKPVMVGTDLVRAALVAGLVVAPSLPVLLILVFLKTSVATFFAPADQATIRIIVPESQLHQAVALSQLVTQSTKIIGPALGGLIVAVASPRVAFGIDAVTFLASAAILSRLRPVDDPSARRAEEASEDEGGYWVELREGLAYIAARRALVLCIVGFGATIFLLFCFDSLSALAFQQLGVSKALFGLAIAGIGAGGVVGTIAVGRYGGDVNPFLLLGGGTAIVGGCVTLLGVALLADLGAPPWIWTPVLVVVGIASAGILVASPTIIQKETPPELMGRVSTSATAIPTGLQMFAPIAGAAVAEWQSVGFLFAGAGGALAALGFAVVAARVPVGVGVSLQDAADMAVAAAEPRGEEEPHEASSDSDEFAAVGVATTTATKVNGRATSVRPESHKEAYMSNADRLREAGVGVPDGGDDAVDALSAEEVDSLIAIKAKLDGTDEVAGHARALADTGYVVW